MRRLLTTALIFGVVTAGATVALGTGAAWATTTCNGTVGPPTIMNTTIYDSVFVPSGGFCLLQNVKVYGGVTASPGSELDVQNSVVYGNVSGQGGLVQVYGPGTSQVYGSVSATSPQTENGNGGSFALCGTKVGGGVSVTGIPTPTSNGYPVGGMTPRITCVGFGGGNQISGTVNISNNNAAGDISNNTISGSLNCSGNVPPPTGGSNTAPSKTGQCAGF
ncbi:MAG: hypothetical protein JO265_16720 [Acidimicrobiia bacterium]|nr:hypothetical protein [Acidimicrobiia bacterium]